MTFSISFVVNQTRRPASTGMFSLLHFREENFWTVENVFFSEKYSFSVIFSTFSKCIWFFARETSWLVHLGHFQEIIPFHTHSTANFPALLILKNFRLFLQKAVFFFKKPNFWTFWKILLFEVHSTANLLHFDFEKCSGSKTWTSIVNAIGKHRLKNPPFDQQILLSCFGNIAQNNNHLNVCTRPDILPWEIEKSLVKMRCVTETWIIDTSKYNRSRKVARWNRMPVIELLQADFIELWSFRKASNFKYRSLSETYLFCYDFCFIALWPILPKLERFAFPVISPNSFFELFSQYLKNDCKLGKISEEFHVDSSFY